MATYHSENRAVLEYFAHHCYPNNKLFITDNRDPYELWDGEILDSQGNVIALIESKVRTNKYNFKTLLVDNNKVERLITVGIERKIPVYLMEYFINTDTLYVAELVTKEGLRKELGIIVRDELQRKNNYSQEKIMKPCAHLPASSCSIRRNHRVHMFIKPIKGYQPHTNIQGEN